MYRQLRTILCLSLLTMPAVLSAPSVLRAQAAGPIEKRFTKLEAMVPMRDGVKLHTILFTPKDVKGPLPFIFYRTPYGGDARGPQALQGYLKDLADEGYIFVFQDIRGRFKSEGTFVMSRMPRDKKD